MKIGRLRQSFLDALKGFRYVYRHEQNFRLQLAISLLVILAGLLLGLSRSEWVVVVLLVFSVLGLEVLNTVLEKFLDLLRPRLLDQVRVLKDITAAMVLLASICSFLVGLIIFLPYLTGSLASW